MQYVITTHNAGKRLAVCTSIEQAISAVEHMTRLGDLDITGETQVFGNGPVWIIIANGIQRWVQLEPLGALPVQVQHRDKVQKRKIARLKTVRAIWPRNSRRARHRTAKSIRRSDRNRFNNLIRRGNFLTD